MTTIDDPVDLLAGALEQAASLLAGVRADQQELPTPCRSWTVAGLGDHLVHDLSQFLKSATGEQPDWSEPTPPVRGDRVAAFRAGADELVAAWRKAGDLTGTITMPGMGELPARFPVDQQTAEFAVHAWDLARATGQSTDLDPAIGQASLAWMRGALPPPFRGAESDGKAFGPEVAVPADAPLYDRLAGFAGRDPSHN